MAVAAAKDEEASAAAEDPEEAVGDKMWSRRCGALPLSVVLESRLAVWDRPDCLAAVALLETWPSPGEGQEVPWTMCAVRWERRMLPANAEEARRSRVQSAEPGTEAWQGSRTLNEAVASVVEGVVEVAVLRWAGSRGGPNVREREPQKGDRAG